MGINSRVTKTETLDCAVDILLFRKFCLDHVSFEKNRIISNLWEHAAFAFFGTSENRDEKLADLIGRFELKFNKSGSQKFNFWFKNVFPRQGVAKSRLSRSDYSSTKSLVGYILNRNLEGRGYYFFSEYKKVSDDVKNEIKDLFVSRMEKYQSKTKGELVASLTTDKKEIYTEYDLLEDNKDKHPNEDDKFDTNTESIEILEFELEKRYLAAKSNQENIEDRSLTKKEIEDIIRKVIEEFEKEYEGFDEAEIEAVVSLFYTRVNLNN